jgi:TRAP-type C4-dicarboxylate transport system permease small subunit
MGGTNLNKRMMKPKQLINKTVNVFVFLAMFSMVIMIFGNAVARYVFKSGLPITEELSRFAFVWVSFLGAILAYYENKHVGVDMLLNKLTGLKKLIIQLCSDLLVILAITVIGIGGFIYFNMTAVLKSPASDIPMGIITVTALILAISMLFKAALDVKGHIGEYAEYKKRTVL